MYPRPFEYFSPKNLAEALELLQNLGAETKILAGGQSLIPSLKLRTLSPKNVVDITGIKELDYILKEDRILKIGALTTTGTLENEPEIAEALPILTETASEIADPLVRNLGTVGGNLCHADPTNDLPAIMIALNASFAIASKQGIRTIHSDSFFLDKRKTAIKPSEILKEIQVPLKECKVGSAYRKVKKGSGGFAIAGAAAHVSVADDNSVSECRIAMTAVGPKPLRASEAEEAFIGKKLEASALDNVAKLAVKASKPATDINASEEYRRRVLSILVKDALESAYKRAVMGNYEKS
jgi:CO/xanthine dehydrogenase FAD-binding subunit